VRRGAARQSDLKFGRLRFGFGKIEGGFGLIDLRFVFARIDLYQHIPCFDVYVIVDRQRDDVTRDLGCDGRDVGVDLRASSVDV
jgi:hypothetical protein